MLVRYKNLPMSKILIIHSCDQCPHFAAKPILYSDNEYKAICENPLIDTVEWVTKIRNTVYTPNFCPLENYNESN